MSGDGTLQPSPPVPEVGAEMMNGSSSRCPFTASQWQELEHQALIFKYMASGAPVPQDLIGPIRRSLYLEPASTSPMLLFHHQPNIGWGCFQMGFGKKVEDPEPWRCRRTDGKKWRCSKEAFPDSKYCERHMHRGKNRSRKPVEISIAATSTPAAAPTSPSLYPGHHLSMVTAAETQHLLNPYAASSRGHDFIRDPSSSSDRNRHGMKEPVDHQRDASWRFTPLGLSPLGERRQRSCSFLSQDSGAAAQDEKRRHCFVLGTDIRAERGSEASRPVSFLTEEWSPKGRDERAGWGAIPMTQLSISMAHYDFQVDSSRSAAGN